jgi:hypothetical protein
MEIQISVSSVFFSDHVDLKINNSLKLLDFFYPAWPRTLHREVVSFRGSLHGHSV